MSTPVRSATRSLLLLGASDATARRLSSPPAEREEFDHATVDRGAADYRIRAEATLDATLLAASQTRFDAALCWIGEPAEPGFLMVELLAAQLPSLPVIAVGDDDTAARGTAALRAGARDYVSAGAGFADRLTRALSADEWGTPQRRNDRENNGLLEAAPDAIIIIDAAGRIELVNQRTEAMFGFRREELVGQSVEALVPERFRARHRVHRERYFRAPAFRPIGAGIDLYGLRKSGDEFPVEISLSPLRLEGRLLATAAVRDISQRRQLESGLRRNERLAAMGVLTAGIAHEINNPVGAALLTAETAKALLDVPDARAPLEECLDNIIASMQRCGQIVKNILRFSREDPVEKAPENLNAIVRQAHDLVRGYASRNGVAIAFDLDPELPNLSVCALEIELLLVNILRNALEACAGQGHVVVTTRDDGGHVRIVVRDDGRGMTEEQVQHLFDPFYSNRGRTGGTGLGMSIAYGIVREHDGSIDVTSAPGKGTAITIRLPKDSGGEPPA
ncbi:MAG: ATP-binding protein [Planctomycetaceae bacterium]